MDDATTAKIATNVANLHKMASTWVVGLVTALAAFYLYLPEKCPAEEPACTTRAAVLAQLPIPKPWLPVIGLLIPFLVARSWVQKGITPEVAAAKSADS